MIDVADPDRSFALGHVPAARRAAVAALWALDEQLGQIVASTTQPMVGQMRLLWWREAIERRAGGHPLLAELTSVFDHGIGADDLGPLVDGWEELLEPLPLSDEQLGAFGRLRGGTLFELTAQLCDVTCPSEAGTGWSLADFAFRCSDAVTARRAMLQAQDLLGPLDIRGAPRPLRILVRFARNDLARGTKTVRTAWQLLRSVA